MFEPYLAEYRYYLLFVDGRGQSDVGNAKSLHRSVTRYDEERYAGRGRWVQSRDLSRAGERDSDDEYREATPAEVEQFTRRTDAEPREEPPPWLPDARRPVELAGVLALLAARRRAGPVDGHYYFAVFESLDDVPYLDRAHAVIRCPSSGDGDWETYLREGEWVPGREPRDDVVLPIGRDDVHRVIRARETAEARYFDVWHGRHAWDVVRRTGPVDETPDDLGWRHTDVFRRLRPEWRVVELGERRFGSARHVAVMTARSRRFGDRRHDYHAIFRNREDIYDLDNAVSLVRRLPNPYELEYELLTPDGWQFRIGAYGGTALPISEEEFERLAAPRPDERGAGDLRR